MWQVFKYPLNPFSKQRHSLTTDLTVEECRSRLGEWLSSGEPEVPSDRPEAGWQVGVCGSTNPSGFAIRQETTVRNRFQTEALGQLIPTQQGTRIELEFGSSRGARLLAVAALALSGFISVALVLRWQRDPFSEWSGYSLPFAVLFPPFIYGYLAASRWLTRNEGPRLLRWLRNVLEANEERSQEPAVRSQERG